MASGTVPKYAAGIDSGWQSITGTANNSYPFTGTIYYRKIGDVFYLTTSAINLKSQLAAKSYILLFTLAEGYRPITGSLVVNGFINTSAVDNRTIPLRIAGNGEMYIYSNLDAIETSYNIYISGVGLLD